MGHDADEAVPIEVIRAVICGVVKQLRVGLEFRTVFLASSMERNTAELFREGGTQPNASLAVTAIHLRRSKAAYPSV